MSPQRKGAASGRCVVPNCTSNAARITIHRFPKDPIKAEAWKRAVRNPNIEDLDIVTLNKFHVCKLHFSPDDYLVHTNRPTLREGAVPILLLPQDHNQDTELTV